MDSEHRHELKRNELAVFISDLPKQLKNLPEIIKNNLWTTLCVAVIIVAIFMWIGKKNGHGNVRNIRKQAELTSYYQGIESAKSRIQTGDDTVGSIIAVVESIESAARNADTANQEAVALIKAGDGIRSELYYRKDMVEPQELEDTILKARQKYEIALKKAGDSGTAAAMAEFGLALCDEDTREFDGAVEKYRAIVDNPAYANTAIPMLAQIRLKFMPDYRTEFAFAEPEAETTVEDTSELEISPAE